MTGRLLACVACSILASCAGGSETGNPAAPTPIGLGLRSSDPSAVAIRNGGEGTVIAHAWVAFGQLAFFEQGTCQGIDSFEHMGSTLIARDLVAPDVRIKFDVHPGTYCGLIVPLENASQDLSGSAPQALHDHSIVLEGQRRDGVAFTLEYPMEDELELTALSAAGFTVHADRKLLLVFDVAAWMKGVDLEHAELESDGTIRIDETRNVPLRLQFEANIECSLELFEDSNGSGTLEAGDKQIGDCAKN